MPNLNLRLHRSTNNIRTGVTLVELLISVTITLLVIFAIVQVFDLMGDTMAKGRATIEMAGSLRSVANRLQNDLDNLTCPVEPWIDPAAGLGYFEYIEGELNNFQSDLGGLVDSNSDGVFESDTTLGDQDDVLMFTARSSKPFFGRTTVGGQPSIESNIAEIAWWVRQSGTTSWLHRRALLIRPDLNTVTISTSPEILGVAAFDPNFLNENDLSVRLVTDSSGNPLGFVANSLSDLTNPENRFAHSKVPNWELFEFNRLSLDARRLVDNRASDDILLADVRAFDVKAYDPNAAFRIGGTSAMAPHDYDYGNAPTLPNPPTGCFVDLNFSVYQPSTSDSLFDGAPEPLANAGIDRTWVSYDTWSLGLERDGIDQDGFYGVDQGFNGLDDDTSAGVDDAEERETRPPYPHKLQGIEVTIRVIEFGTRQVRQVSVVGDFGN